MITQDSYLKQIAICTKMAMTPPPLSLIGIPGLKKYMYIETR